MTEENAADMRVQAMKASMPNAGDGLGLSEDDSEDDSDDDADDDEVDDADADDAVIDVNEDSGSASDFPSLADEDDDLVPLEEMPDIELDGKTEGDEEESENTGKRKRNDERKERRKKRKALPVFGSYEDYAAMIEAGGSEGDE